MSQPSSAEMRQFMERHVELWNAAEKEPWLAHQKAACPGGLTMEDPVGTPVKQGVDILGEVWDEFFADNQWTLTIEHLVTCANELAAVVRNESVVNGTPVVVHSIEIYQFGDDGSLHVRTYWNPPDGSA